MVKRFLILAVALVLQCASVTQAGEPRSTPRNTNAMLAKLKVDIEMARNQTGVPGMSVAIMHKGKLIFAEGFGKRNKKDPFTAETRSMIGSITKGFTATAVAELVAEGKMDWDTTPVNTYLPEFETIDPVLTSQLTMQDLLSHRTNFPPLDFTWVWSNETRKELIKRIRHIEVEPKFRATMNYNNVMYAVAGEAAANAAGISFEKLVRSKVLRPLGLSNSGFTMGEMRKRPNHAVPFQAGSFEDAVAGRFTELPLDGAIEKGAAAGDMYGTVLDLARWGDVILKGGKQNGKQVLSKEGIDATLTARVIGESAVRDPDFGLSDQYGMGWGMKTYKGNNIFNHSGRIPGYVSNLFLFPNSELVVAVLTNADLTSLPRFLPYHIADEILGLPKTQTWMTEQVVAYTKEQYVYNDAMIHGILPERIPNKPAAHKLSEYTGEYVNPGWGTATVRLVGGELHITANAFKGVLTHYHYESFTGVFHHTALKLGQLVTFSTNSDGKVSAVTFNVMGPTATFARQQ